MPLPCSPKAMMVAMLLFCALVVGVMYMQHGKRVQALEERIASATREHEAKRITAMAQQEQLQQAIDRHTDELVSRQPLQSQLLSMHGELLLQDYDPDPSHAIVTMVSARYSNSYWMGALALMQSLREVRTRVPNLVVMVFTDGDAPFAAAIEAAFARLDVTLVHMQSIEIPERVEIPGSWFYAFDKLRVWSMTQYSKVLFMDADTIVVQNLDHLLLEPELSAPVTPRNCRCFDPVRLHDHYTISSGFFVCKPSLERFAMMMDYLSRPSPDPEDAEQFGGVWHWGDQEMLRVIFEQESELTGGTWHKLFAYDLPVGQCACDARTEEPIYSYHFVCTDSLYKPWDYYSWTHLYEEDLLPCMREIYIYWLRMLMKGVSAAPDEEGLFLDGLLREREPLA